MAGTSQEETKPLVGGLPSNGSTAVFALEERKPTRLVLGVPISLLSGGCYCMASMSMVSGGEGKRRHQSRHPPPLRLSLPPQ
jgi:hypothetical protein